MKDKTGYYPSLNQHIIEGGLFSFEVSLSSLEGKDVYINGETETTRALVQIYTDPLSKKTDDYKISVRENITLKKGTLINFDNDDFLIISRPRFNDVYRSASMDYCSKYLNWVDSTGKFNSQPFIFKQSGEAASGTDTYYIDYENGKATIAAQFNDTTKLIKIGQRFAFGDHDIWSIKGKSGLSKNGLLEITLQKSEFNPETDKLINIDGQDYWIADYMDHTESTGYDIQFSNITDYLIETDHWEPIVTRLLNGIEEVSTFTFTIDGTSTALPSEYEFNIIDGNSFELINTSGSTNVVVVRVHDNDSLVADDLRSVELGLL